VKQDVTWLQTLDTDLLHAGLQAQVSQWEKYLIVSGYYLATYYKDLKVKVRLDRGETRSVQIGRGV
jgi:hypothetical protein